MVESILAVEPKSLPEGFPDGVPKSRFNIGDRVHWQPHPSQDFGTVTELQYAPAQHLEAWAWKYTIWLDANSPSHPWTTTDSAWEFDLETVPAPMQFQAIPESER